MFISKGFPISNPKRLLFFAMLPKYIVDLSHGEFVEFNNCGLGSEGRGQDVACIFLAVRFNGDALVIAFLSNSLVARSSIVRPLVVMS